MLINFSPFKHLPKSPEFLESLKPPESLKSPELPNYQILKLPTLMAIGLR
jgi:hypothetical protein